MHFREREDWELPTLALAPLFRRLLGDLFPWKRRARGSARKSMQIEANYGMHRGISEDGNGKHVTSCE